MRLTERERTIMTSNEPIRRESGDITKPRNKTDAPMVHVLFEIPLVNLNGPSLIPVRHRLCRGCREGSREVGWLPPAVWVLGR
jgi:hypothetical protein